MNIQGIQGGLNAIKELDPNKNSSVVKESGKADKSSFADVLGLSPLNAA